MRYFLVTKKSGQFGVSISELLKTKQWRDVRRERRLRGHLIVSVRCDYNADNFFYTKDYIFNSGAELRRIIQTDYSDFNVFRYGIDHNKGLIEVDVVKVK